MPNNSTERSYRLVSGTDIRSLPIGPEEAFVLSRIDAIHSEEDLVSATGLSGEAVTRIVNRLAELGAIEFAPTASHGPIGRSSAFPQSPSGAYRIDTAFEALSTNPSQHPSEEQRSPHRSGQFDVRSSSSMPPGSSLPPSSSEADIESRRKAFARKLSQSSMRPAPSVARSMTPSTMTRAEIAEEARQQQVAHYISLADEAESQNDLKSAVNSLRIASSIAPDDPMLASKLKSLQAHAASQLWRDHAEKAEFELYGRRYAEAARLFEQAALGHPCWRFFERAAYCYLHSGGDLKKASELAKRAVVLGPEIAKCHFTLAQVYVAAKLKESALAELERAHSLDPKQEAIRDYIRMVRKSVL